ncbi:hypothetical protein ABBQ32_006983 [Trebouxia sp. C0010 RCD-2024]
MMSESARLHIKTDPDAAHKHKLVHEPVNAHPEQGSSSSFQRHIRADEQGSTNILQGQEGLPDTYWARELVVDREEWNTYLRGELPKHGFRSLSRLYWSLLCCLTSHQQSKPDMEKAGKRNNESAGRTLFRMTTLAPSRRISRAWIFLIGSIDLWYTAFLMPVLIVFPTNRSSYIWGAVINLICGGLFYWVDIIMRFRTGFCVVYNLKRGLIMDGRLIAHFYIFHDTFFTDLIAAAPSIAELVWVCIAGTDYGLAWHIILLLRLARMLRVFTLIKGMLTMTLTGQYSRKLFRGLSVGHVFMLMLTYITFWLLNLLGCSWVWLAGVQGKENSWMQSIGNELDISGKPPARQWIAAVYFAVMMVTTVGLGDIKACTPAEEVLASFQMLLGVFLFGLIVSTSQSVLGMLSDNARTMGPLRQKLQYVDVWLRRRHLSDRLARRVRAYYTEIWVDHEDLGHDNYYDELPSDIRTAVAAEISREVFSSSCFLSVLHDRARRSLCERLKPYSLPSGHDACQEGDDCNTIWLLTEGEMMSSVREKKEEYVAAPAVVGETAILASCLPEHATRHSTYQAVAPCTLWTLHIKDLDILADLYPELAKPLQDGLLQHLQNQHIRMPGPKWLQILRRYEALPDEKKPFAAPSNRKHVTEDSSSEVEETGYEHGVLDNNADEAAIDSQEQSDLLQHKAQPSRSGVTESDDTARAQQLGRQVPAQRMYTQRPQLPSDWQR